MKMNFDTTKMVEEIVMQATENQEEFIFETIRPYCEDILQMKINKKELKQMLLKQQPCEDAYCDKCKCESPNNEKERPYYQAKVINEIGATFKKWSRDKEKIATYIQLLEIAEDLDDDGRWFVEILCNYMDNK